MSYLKVEAVESATLNLAAAYPELCTLIPLPNATFEGRTCHALRLGAGAPGSRDCIMVVGGLHGREWGSCEIAINFAADLLEAYSTSAGLAYGGQSFTAGEIQAILDHLHLLIFPLVNPDGRKYSESVEALWRRNRNPAGSGGNPKWIGVDINRNFDFLFNRPVAFSSFSDVWKYTSNHPADEVYQGPSPFSEPETQNVKWLLDANPRTRWFLDLHCYTQDILWVWGHDQNQPSDPSMNFQNPAFDGQRGVKGDAYKEFFNGSDFGAVTKLAGRFNTALGAVRGKSYKPMQSFDLYPTCGTSQDYVFSRHLVDPALGKVHAFTIEWGTEFQPLWEEMVLIVADVTAGLIAFALEAPCGGGVPAVLLDTPAVTFQNVPVNIETSRPIEFTIQTCSAIDLQVTAGPSVVSGSGAFHVPLGGNSLPSAWNGDERELRIWVAFKGTTPGDVTKGTMTVHCPQTSKDYVIALSAHTIAPPKVASVVVLDRSGSMKAPSGIPGKSRIDILHAAAPAYPALLPDADGIGVVSFDTGAQLIMPVAAAGLGGRDDAVAAIGAHVPNILGLTAIGDGVELAHTTLQPLTGYDSKAIVVFTDGKESAPKYIDQISDVIDERVFAIGLGTVEELSPVALNKLVQNTGGYLLMTDKIGSDDTFRLAKYFVQIAAGVTNAQVVLDPDGVLPPGLEVRIPFDLTEADYGADAILLAPAPWAAEFQLETPEGMRIHRNGLADVSGATLSTSEQLAFYRLDLPLLANGSSTHSGRWHVVLQLSEEKWRRYLTSVPREQQGAASLGLPYSVIVHARSSLALAVHLTQTSQEPGATLQFRALLTEIGLPMEHRVRVRADISRPDGSRTRVTLSETEPGVFEGRTVAPLPGAYQIRVRASGESLRGFHFMREQTRTGLVWRGGDDPVVPRDDGKRRSVR